MIDRSSAPRAGDQALVRGVGVYDNVDTCESNVTDEFLRDGDGIVADTANESILLQDR